LFLLGGICLIFNLSFLSKNKKSRST
jgi:hypothetical protein